MAAPAIRDLNVLVNELGQSVKGQKALIDADIASNAQAGQAQIEGLQAQQQQAFGQIEQAASDKGMFFSGFSPDQQAQYTSTTYLPALANLQATIAQTRSALMGKKADLDTNVFNKAFDTREGDISRRFSFDERVASQEFQRSERIAGQEFSASEAEKARQFEARENAATRAAQAAQSAASRAAEPSAAQNMAIALTSKVGGDGFVSPGTWNALRAQWTSGGYGSAASFDQSFADYRNPKNPHYKVGK